MISAPNLQKPSVLRLANKLVMVVDDDRDHVQLVAAALEFEGYRVEVASDGAAAIARLKTVTPDLVILDIEMPGADGFETLRALRQSEKYVSVIFLSGVQAPERVIAGLDAGADDYICKPFDPRELLARVRAQLRIQDLTQRLELANRRLQELVDIDDLTGLYNMRSVYSRLDSEIARAKRFGRAVGVVMMDMDNFKHVNDNHDHLFGSYVLSEVGKLIRDNIRQVDFAARYGGDEFLITLSETAVDGAQLFTERLRKVIENSTFATKSDSMKMTASMGLAVVEPAHFHVDARGLVRLADHALYEAKHAGKNCVRVFTADAGDLRRADAGDLTRAGGAASAIAAIEAKHVGRKLKKIS
jgi:diguanylate cyclase (GGDEF)-like protein